MARGLRGVRWGRTGGIAGARLPVGLDQCRQRDVEGSRDAHVEADGDVSAAFDALNLPVADAGGVAQLFLGEVSPLADAGDVPADAPELSERLRGEWIFWHTATLEVRGLRDHARPDAFIDLEVLLIGASATDNVERVTELTTSHYQG